MDLTLTADVENALSAQASLQGTTPEQLALDALRKMFVTNGTDSTMSSQPVPLLQLLDGFIGVLDSSELPKEKQLTSEDTGKAFTQILLEKRKQGKF